MARIVVVLITGLWLGVPACSAIAADQLPDLIRVRTEGGDEKGISPIFIFLLASVNIKNEY